MKILLVLSTLLAIAGCVNEETVLRNAAGEERYCYLVHDNTLAKIPATEQYNKCLNDAGTAGFKKVSK